MGGDEFECIFDNEPIGTADVWKHYVAIGSMDLLLLNLNCKNTRKTLWKQTEEWVHTAYVSNQVTQCLIYCIFIINRVQQFLT